MNLTDASICCNPRCTRQRCQAAQQGQEQTYATAPHRNRPVDFGELPPVPYRPNQPDNLDGSEFRYAKDDPRASWNQPNAVPLKTWGDLTNEDWIKLTSSQLASKWDAEARAQHELNNKSLVFRRVRDGATAVAVPLSEQRVREIVREELKLERARLLSAFSNPALWDSVFSIDKQP